jgi:hypothetical protein
MAIFTDVKEKNGGLAKIEFSFPFDGNNWWTIGIEN